MQAPTVGLAPAATVSDLLNEAPTEPIPPAGCSHLRYGLFHRRLRPFRHWNCLGNSHGPVAPERRPRRAG